MKRLFLVISLLSIGVATMAMDLPDIHQVRPDLSTPPTTAEAPAPGKRVKQVLPEYAGTEVYHVLYLPADWQAGRKYPVLVEYAGNGGFTNKLGDTCTGRPEDCGLGYGISAGKGCIWVCLPYVSMDHKTIQLNWWGDVEATVAYCKAAVRKVCAEYGGDSTAVIITGFSRGAIACNYIGLHDDEIASLWLAFIPHSHYDGVRTWGYPGDDRASALERLKRLKGRPQFISQEVSTAATENYLRETGVSAPFTFQPLPYKNHTDTWVLRDIPERRRLREWVQKVVQERSAP